MPAIVNSNNVFLGSNGGGSVNYTAGKYIDISENIISVSGLEPYTAGPNIDITDNVISGKNWTTDINNASSYAYEQATAHGVEYTGISPIDVNNTTHQISADVWTLSARNGISILEDDVNKITTIDLTGDFATHEELNSSTSGKADISGVVEYTNKPVSGGKIVANGNTFSYVDAIYGSGVSINQSYLWLNSAVEITPNGIKAAGLSANNNDTYFCIKSQPEVFSGGGGAGFTFSSYNTAFGTAKLTVNYYTSPTVQVYSPAFIAKNISGAGFSIEASAAKGYDHNGNVIWDTTKAPAPQQLIAGSDSPRPNILLSPYMPMNMSAQFSNAPLLSANGDVIYIGNSGQNVKTQMGGLTARNGYIKAEIADNSGNVTGNSTINGAEVSVYHSSAFGSANSGEWRLTQSVQKREIECDTATSAITAIAGSAIGGIAGETIDLSAGEGISIVETGDKVLISNNISAGSNMSFVYDSETNKIRIDANDAFPITATDGNTTWSADCKASAFTMGRNTSRTDIGAFGFEYRQAPSVNVSGSWYDLALLMEKFKYAIPVEVVANSGLATGQNILYVVTGN